MWLAAQILGVSNDLQSMVRDFTWGTGGASYLRAIALLKVKGRLTFLQQEADLLWATQTALKRIESARSQRHKVGREVFPALLPSWRADATLRVATVNTAAVQSGTLAESELRRRGSLLIRGFTRRW